MPDKYLSFAHRLLREIQAKDGITDSFPGKIYSMSFRHGLDNTQEFGIGLIHEGLIDAGLCFPKRAVLSDQYMNGGY